MTNVGQRTKAVIAARRRVRNDRLSKPRLLCSALLFLAGCCREPTVNAMEKRLQGPFQHIDNAPPCRRGATKNVVVTAKDGAHYLAFNLLNSELVACEIDAGTSAVEPGWTVDPWYDHTDVHGREQDFKKKLKTSLLFEPLFQSLHRKSATREEQSPPPSGHDQRLPRNIANQTSLILFNRSARNEVAKQYSQWPSGTSTIHHLSPSPFSESAKAMKLEFVGVDLKRNTQKYEVQVVVAKNRAKPLMFVEMNPASKCIDGGANLGTFAHPIPMNCFYYVVVHKLPHDPANQHHFSYRRDCLIPDKDKPALDMDHDVVYLLRGFHLIQADQAAWTWSTFWWTPRRRTDSFCKISSPFRGSACELPWSFYDMDDQRYDPNMDKPDPHFNPYIETNNQSNCIYCHARALDHSDAEPPGKDDFSSARDYLGGPLLPCFATEVSGKPSDLSPSDVNCGMPLLRISFGVSPTTSGTVKPSPRQPNKAQLLLPLATENS